MTAIVGQFVRIHPHSYRCKAVTHARIHTDMPNKADYTLPMTDVTSAEDSFVYLFCPQWSTYPSGVRIVKLHSIGQTGFVM